MKVQTGIMRVWLAVPATFPVFLFGMLCDIVYRKTTGCEPPDIKPDSGGRLWILALVEYRMEKSRLVGVWIERCLGDQRI